MWLEEMYCENNDDADLNGNAGSVEDLQRGSNAQDAHKVLRQQRRQQRMLRRRQPSRRLHCERHARRVDRAHRAQALRAGLLALPLADAVGLRPHPYIAQNFGMLNTI